MFPSFNKNSNFEDKKFYPVIFKVGTGRRGVEGIRYGRRISVCRKRSRFRIVGQDIQPTTFTGGSQLGKKLPEQVRTEKL